MQQDPPGLVQLFAISAVAPVGFSIVAPSLPAVSDAFGASDGQVFGIMSVFMLIFGLMQLVLGPLSDRFGRRRVLLAGLAIFTTASLWCACTDSLDSLMLARVAQAIGGCVALAIPRAVVRDAFDGAQQGRAMAVISLNQSLVPAVAPLLGGLLVTLLSWRAVFLFCAGYGLLALVWAAASLPETMGRNESQERPSLHAIAILVRRPTYLAYLLNAALLTAPYVIYLAAAPALFRRLLGLGPGAFGAYNLLLVPCILIGTVAAARLTPGHAPTRLIASASLVALAGVSLLLALSDEVSVWRLLVPILVYVMAHAVVYPLSVGAAIATAPGLAGTAAGGVGFAHMAVGALALLLAGASPNPELQAMAGLCVAATVAGLLALLLARAGAVQPAPAGVSGLPEPLSARRSGRSREASAEASDGPHRDG
jgi:DHA1 family bicyclomycin/chloramphenicol resistance-like MFS transporter